MWGGEGGDLLAQITILRPPDWTPGTGVDGKCRESGGEWGCSGHGKCSDLGYFCYCDPGYAWRSEGGIFTCRSSRRRLGRHHSSARPGKGGRVDARSVLPTLSEEEASVSPAPRIHILTGSSTMDTNPGIPPRTSGI